MLVKINSQNTPKLNIELEISDGLEKTGWFMNTGYTSSA